jgi:hypothetical protein
MATSNGNLFFLGTCQRIFGYSENLLEFKEEVKGRGGKRGREKG